MSTGTCSSSAIPPYIIPVGVLPLHCPTVPHSPPSVSPTFLTSSTRQIPPSDKSSGECRVLKWIDLWIFLLLDCNPPIMEALDHEPWIPRKVDPDLKEW